MDYKIVKYSEIGKIRSGKRLPKGYTVSEKISDNKYIRVRDINSGSIDSSIVQYITDEAAEKLERYKVKTRDVIISVVGTLNGAYLTENCDNLQVDESLCLKDYLKYYLLSEDGSKEIIANTVGSTQPKLPIYGIENFNIKLPSIDNQKRMIKLLNSIDKKIKLNNEINNNLFELLKQKFREKFYNEEGKNSYLIDYISNTIGGDWGKESPEGNNNTKVYCVRGADIPSMEYGNKGNAPIRYILEKNYENKKLNPNNIIIEISGGSPTQSTGRTAYITKSILDMYNFPLLCTNFCRAIEAKSDILSPFVYMNLKLMYEDDIFFNWENGTTGIKNLALNDMLSNLEVKSPNEIDLKDFYLLFNSIINKMSNNSNENIKLEQLRDTLLPKLMNGEIDLDNIEI